MTIFSTVPTTRYAEELLVPINLGLTASVVHIQRKVAADLVGSSESKLLMCTRTGPTRHRADRAAHPPA